MSTSDLRFFQVTEVEKREPREKFLKPRPQAEAEKCSPRFPFFVRGNLEILKPDMDTFCQRKWREQILKQNAFFIFLAFSLALCNNFIGKNRCFSTSDGKMFIHMDNDFAVRRSLFYHFSL